MGLPPGSPSPAAQEEGDPKAAPLQAGRGLPIPWDTQEKVGNTKELQTRSTLPSPASTASITSSFTLWLMFFQTFPGSPRSHFPSPFSLRMYLCIGESGREGKKKKIVLSGWQLSEGYIIKGTNHRCRAIIARWMRLSGAAAAAGGARRDGGTRVLAPLPPLSLSLSRRPPPLAWTWTFRGDNFSGLDSTINFSCPPRGLRVRWKSSWPAADKMYLLICFVFDCLFCHLQWLAAWRPPHRLTDGSIYL